MSDSDEDENFGRTDEVIDLETVNTGSSTKKPPQKSLLPADYQSDDTPKSMISNQKAAVEESKESQQIVLNMASEEGLRDAL